MPQLPNLDHLSHAEKDALIRALWQRLEAAERRIAELETRLGEPGKTASNSSLPPSKGQKPNRPEKTRRGGPRKGSLGRSGGGRALVCHPDDRVPPSPLPAGIVMPFWRRPIRCCTVATTRSTCHRCVLW
jgi:transposase